MTDSDKEPSFNCGGASDASSPEDVLGEASRRLMRTFGLFRKRQWEQMSISGFTAGEIKVLMALKFHPPAEGTDGLKVSEISGHMGVTSPTITQFINGLESRDLVTRFMDANDRRAVRVKLTAQGHHIADKAHEAFNVHFKGLVEYLGEEESMELARLLTKVYTYLIEHEIDLNPADVKGES
ncbi:MarR family winged helix-turn-helix transcriptional regulator [Paenibacillus lemnae]|uniref:Winged helix-turn-helix transcriptional regulator n=1 Tax=Paenibacillus lemnae TaxID=1330551 RepID=A0A848M2L7_PAELE|nr:MarR family winged helix-turn-helix transcriptional regulator [Paenibacillus lemnae]NMO94480.1 winged helix-turn-helix transcriptional regulator [Paenibacillus lemnae]